MLHVTLLLQGIYPETLLERARLLGVFLEQGRFFLVLRYLIVESETEKCQDFVICCLTRKYRLSECVFSSHRTCSTFLQCLLSTLSDFRFSDEVCTFGVKWKVVVLPTGA